MSKIIKNNSDAFVFLVALFVATLLISNIASTKLFSLGSSLVVDGGTILFPLVYILGDIITEVYGFRKAKKVIFIGFLMSVLMAVTFLAVQYLPPAPGWENQDAFKAILGFAPRIVFASMVAYLVGELINSYILAKLKVATEGRYLWLRTIGSTLVASLIDTIVFSVIAFGGLVPTQTLISLIATVYAIKITVEILITPLTYYVVGKLKKYEQSDPYDKAIGIKDLIK